MRKADRLVSFAGIALPVLACAAGVLAQTEAPRSETPVSDKVEHVAVVAGQKVMAVSRGAERAVRHAASDTYRWAEREGVAAQRPRGLYVFTPTPATDASGSAHPDPGPDWTAAPSIVTQLPRRVAVLVHGLDEEGDIWTELAPALKGAGHTVVQFDYPNDGPLTVSAALLADALRDLAGRGVTHVDLICHSMGGLVARDCLTRPSAYGGDGRAHNGLPTVDRCVMLGTPNRGAALAHLEVVTEVREQVVRFFDDPHHDPRQLLGFLADGRGEAARDLLPGSAFLTELNGRPPPTHVSMTVVVGEVKPTSERSMHWLTDCSVARRVVGHERLDSIASSYRGIAAGLGDGVVTVGSAELPGVPDTVRVCASHRGMLRASSVERFLLRESTGEAAPAIPVILERLGPGAGAAPSAHTQAITARPSSAP